MKPPPAKQRIIEPLDEKDLEQAEHAVLAFKRSWRWMTTTVLAAICILGLVLMCAG